MQLIMYLYKFESTPHDVSSVIAWTQATRTDGRSHLLQCPLEDGATGDPTILLPSPMLTWHRIDLTIQLSHWGRVGPNIIRRYCDVDTIKNGIGYWCTYYTYLNWTRNEPNTIRQYLNGNWFDFEGHTLNWRYVVYIFRLLNWTRILIGHDSSNLRLRFTWREITYIETSSISIYVWHVFELNSNLTANSTPIFEYKDNWREITT